MSSILCIDVFRFYYFMISIISICAIDSKILSTIKVQIVNCKLAKLRELFNCKVGLNRFSFEKIIIVEQGRRKHLKLGGA